MFRNSLALVTALFVALLLASFQVPGHALLITVSQFGTAVRTTDHSNIGIAINANKNGYNTGGSVNVLNNHGRFFGIVSNITVPSTGVAIVDVVGLYWPTSSAHGPGQFAIAQVFVNQGAPHGWFGIVVTDEDGDELFNIGFNANSTTYNPSNLVAGYTVIRNRP